MKVLSQCILLRIWSCACLPVSGSGNMRFSVVWGWLPWLRINIEFFLGYILSFYLIFSGWSSFAVDLGVSLTVYFCLTLLCTSQLKLVWCRMFRIPRLGDGRMRLAGPFRAGRGLLCR